MSLQKPLQIAQFAKERYLTKWHMGLIFVVLLVPCSIECHLQTVAFDTPVNTHPAKIMTTKGSDSDQHHEDLHTKDSIHFTIYVSDSPATMESFSKDMVKAVSDAF